MNNIFSNIGYFMLGGLFLFGLIFIIKQLLYESDNPLPTEADRIRAQATIIQSSVPRLEPGALFSAAITPLPGNTIQFAIKLSPEARAIIAREHLNPVRVLSMPNDNYEKEKQEYEHEQRRLRSSTSLTKHIEANITPEPPKVYDVTIEWFTSPCGITRTFPSAAEAKAWTIELRKGIELLQRELEMNETPAEAETFNVMRRQ